ncbi:MAG: asparaginase, partial [Paracoccaceae bacterium]
RNEMIKSDHLPCQWHNNCSGKHSGFLTLAKHLKAGSEYIAPEHPVQKAVLEAFEMTTGSASPGFGIDGCSAPNFAARLKDIAKAMAWFASAEDRSDPASRAAVRLVNAMRTHPLLVAGEGRACTELMHAMGGRVAIKTGAEGFFVAIIPERKLGVALKITDGASRASACALATLLAEIGVLDKSHPIAQKYLNQPVINRRGIETGRIHAASALHL